MRLRNSERPAQLAALEAIERINRACTSRSRHACMEIAALVHAGKQAGMTIADGPDGLDIVIRITGIRTLTE